MVRGVQPWWKADVVTLTCEQLQPLADAYGVATSFNDWRGQHKQVSVETVLAVLKSFGVVVTTEDDVRTALHEHKLAYWRRTLVPTTVVRQGQSATLEVHVPDGDPVSVVIQREDGLQADTVQIENWRDAVDVDGEMMGEASFRIPDDLPQGWHEAIALDGYGAEIGRSTVIVVPHQVPDPEPMTTQRWGVMAQLYSVMSNKSWRLGDFGDLADLAEYAAGLGADFVLINPVHAGEPCEPLEPSPYLPTSRRWVNPVYIRPERITEYQDASNDQQRSIHELCADVRNSVAADDYLDRDVVWSAKRQALEIIFSIPRTTARQKEFDDFCRQGGEELAGFARWCAEYEMGNGATQNRSKFYQWLQWICREQLHDAHQTAISAGMSYGIVHDLAVGVHPSGADAAVLTDVLAHDMTVGAPPDSYNQIGQDWSQPPWRPDALACSGYKPFREMIRAVLRDSGGVRIDHIMGLFRLWWIPDGHGPGDGTYVHYDHEALVGIVCLEAARAGAFVVGEDLGTVEEWIRDYLRERNLLGSSVLWFEIDGDHVRRPEQWRPNTMATVTTHDLPPTAGYLALEHVTLRHDLDLLAHSVDDEMNAAVAERDTMLRSLLDENLLGSHEIQFTNPADTAQVVVAMHEFLTRTPSKILGVSLADLVGERRTQNQPGTYREYPNWRIPLADGNGTVVTLDDLIDGDLALPHQVAAAMKREKPTN